jgi:hypothetical protein
MRVAIYARVSTDDKGQDPENQLRELRAWCSNSGHTIVQEYIERQSGRRGRTSASSSRHSWTLLPGGSSIACCFGRWTALAVKGWRRR